MRLISVKLLSVQLPSVMTLSVPLLSVPLLSKKTTPTGPDYSAVALDHAVALLTLP